MTLRDWKADYDRLVRVDINDSRVTMLKEFTGDIDASLEDLKNSFDGPRRTVNGRVYYRTNVERSSLANLRDTKRISPIVIPEDQFDNKKLDRFNDEDFILSRGEDGGIYRINIDLSDSLIIASKKVHPNHLPIKISEDRTRYMIRDKICNLDNDRCIEILPFAEDIFSDSCGLGCISYSFNPKTPEVSFTLICEIIEKQHTYIETYYLCTFNYITNAITIIDYLIGMENCMYPAYASDGLKIAFLSEGNAYIIYRRWLNE